MLTLREISWRVGRSGPMLLRDISFTALPGELIAVIGPNGAGKSTLLKLIAGDHAVQTGILGWCGRDLQRIPQQELAKQRAVLGQRNEIGLGFTVREVVMMGRYPHFTGRPSPRDEQAVDRAMERMHVVPYADRDIGTLSGGEQQRTHIARTLAQVDAPGARPALLLLDEPLNDLDVTHQHELLAHARGLAAAGHVVLAVLHDVNLAAQYAHRILVLSGGRQLAAGDPATVLTRTTLSAAYGLHAHVGPHPFLPVPFVHFAPDSLLERLPGIPEPTFHALRP